MLVSSSRTAACFGSGFLAVSRWLFFGFAPLLPRFCGVLYFIFRHLRLIGQFIGLPPVSAVVFLAVSRWLFLVFAPPFACFGRHLDLIFRHLWRVGQFIGLSPVSAVVF